MKVISINKNARLMGPDGNVYPAFKMFNVTDRWMRHHFANPHVMTVDDFAFKVKNVKIAQLRTLCRNAKLSTDGTREEMVGSLLAIVDLEPQNQPEDETAAEEQEEDTSSDGEPEDETEAEPEEDKEEDKTGEDLEELTVVELRERAKEDGISGYWSMNKETLVKELS